MMRPTASSISSRTCWYSSIVPRLGVATWTNATLVGVERAVLQELLDRLEADPDALGVVEPVDAEDQRSRGLPSSSRMSFARCSTSGVRESSSMAAASIEIGKS